MFLSILRRKTFGLFPALGDFEESYHDIHIKFVLFQLAVGLLGHMASVYLCKKLPASFLSKWLYNFIFPLAVYKSSSYFTP